MRLADDGHATQRTSSRDTGRTRPRFIVRMAAKPGLWTAAWLMTLPAAAQLAPRLQPLPEVDYTPRKRASINPITGLPVAPELVIAVEPPEAAHAEPVSTVASQAGDPIAEVEEPSGEVHILGTYVWDGCHLEPLPDLVPGMGAGHAELSAVNLDEAGEDPLELHATVQLGQRWSMRSTCSMRVGCRACG